jgi:hypothetical protein
MGPAFDDAVLVEFSNADENMHPPSRGVNRPSFASGLTLLK